MSTIGSIFGTFFAGFFLIPIFGTRQIVLGITILLTFPINSIIYKVTGVAVNVALPPIGGVILVLISMILTIIAGLIPAKMASKKDPVEALRTE